MIGCCGASRKKFKTKDGVIDGVRLAEVVESRRQAGWDSVRIQRLEKCTCPCHYDDVNCMC